MRRWFAVRFKGQAGFIIVRTHPFLGASPDGEVDGRLIEAKRIFPKNMTLREAVCKLTNTTFNHSSCFVQN